MTKVKICGLKRKEDIEYVNKYLPDYIGFVFAESKRRVSVELAESLKKNLSPEIKTVGVFVNEDLESLLETIKRLSLDCVQIHGDESSMYIEALKEKLKGERKIEIWKAIRVKDGDSIEKMSEYNVDAFVLDAYIEGAYGGGGKTFDWELASKAKEYGKIILAGGLNTENVKEAIDKLAPFGVDVSSGVETSGYKDGDKIRDFIYKARS